MAVEELDLLKPSLVGEPTRMNEQYSCVVDIILDHNRLLSFCPFSLAVGYL